MVGGGFLIYFRSSFDRKVYLVSASRFYLPYHPMPPEVGFSHLLALERTSYPHIRALDITKMYVLCMRVTRV
jgi:hypothetical protein